MRMYLNNTEWAAQTMRRVGTAVLLVSILVLVVFTDVQAVRQIAGSLIVFAVPTIIIGIVVGLAVKAGTVVDNAPTQPDTSFSPLAEAMMEREVFLFHQEMSNPEFLSWCKQGYRSDI